MASPIREIDVRAPRFAAWVTSAVLAVVLLTGSGVLLAAQAVVFAVGALAGMRYAPYGFVFRSVVAARLGPAREREPEEPVRFAQFVGLLRPRRYRRIPARRPDPRRRRHRFRAGGGPAQRGRRLLPRLRDVPARPPGPAGPGLITDTRREQP
jgi:hypothetical protein